MAFASIKISLLCAIAVSVGWINGGISIKRERAGKKKSYLIDYGSIVLTFVCTMLYFAFWY